MTGKGLVLVTGANGYIAARTIEAFLLAGYSVRGTARSAATTQGVRDALAPYTDRLEIVEVPDITAAGAFDEAVKGVDAVAHLAAPVSFFFTDPEPIMKAAVEGINRMLESAAKEPRIKSFVYMSSIAAVLSLRDDAHRFTEEDWNTKVEAIVAEMGKHSPGPLIYSASKTAAEKTLWKFRDEHKPKFAISSINPVFVAGPPLVTPTQESQVGESYRTVYDVYAGRALDTIPSNGLVPGYVDVRDVSRFVVFAVDHPEKTDGERYIAASACGPPQAMADILRKALPERAAAIDKGTPGDGYLPGYGFPASGNSYDGSKLVRTTGQDYIPFDKTVLDTVESFKNIV